MQNNNQGINSSISRRKILQTTGGLIGLAAAPGVASAEFGESSGNTQVVEVFVEFELEDNSGLAHAENLPFYGINTEKREFYFFSQNQESQAAISENDAVAVGNIFAPLPTVLNKGKELKELPIANESSVPYQYLPIESKIDLPAVNVSTDGTDVVVKARGKETSVPVGEELTHKLSPKGRVDQHGNERRVTPQIRVRNYGDLAVRFAEE